MPSGAIRPLCATRRYLARDAPVPRYAGEKKKVSCPLAKIGDNEALMLTATEVRMEERFNLCDRFMKGAEYYSASNDIGNILGIFYVTVYIDPYIAGIYNLIKRCSILPCQLFNMIPISFK